MSFLSSIFGRSKKDGAPRFMTEKGFRRNLANQLIMSPATLEELWTLGVAASAFRRLDFYFYTNEESKAQALESALRGLGYRVKSGPSGADDGSKFMVNGRTTPLQMDEKTVVAWTEKMCCLGFEHDCEFDGWGTDVGEQKAEE